jgi:hypothetical protein
MLSMHFGRTELKPVPAGARLTRPVSTSVFPSAFPYDLRKPAPDMVHRLEHCDTSRHQPCKSASEKSEDPAFLLERGVFYSRRRDIAEATGKTNGVSLSDLAFYKSVLESISSHF